MVAPLFNADTPIVAQVADWQTPLIADLTDGTITADSADVGKVAFVSEDAGYYVLQSVSTDGATLTWRLDPAIDLTVEGPILVSGAVTAQYPKWHGKRIHATAASAITLPAHLPVGFMFHVCARTANAVTILQDATVGHTTTLTSTVGADTDVEISDTYGWATVILDDIDAYYVAGNIAAVTP